MTAPPQLTDALRERYAFERELGRGGMATVYLAHDLRHGRPVALKLLHPELAATVGPHRFLQEIRLTARLQHPHILPMLDSGETAGQLWYTMPYVEGESLRDRLRRETQVPLDAALRIGREVAEALDYAHRHGVIHRDIKPENIMLSDGQALVADFGVARAIEGGTEEKLTETGMAVGTPVYMSPEQATASGQIDGRSDVYALGCVVYEMLAGEPPFTGPTPQAIIAKRFVHPPLPLHHLRPTVPGWVDAAVATALAQVPADRFATAAEFARALSAAPPNAMAPGQATKAEQPRARRRLVLAGTTALALYVPAALLVLGAVRLLITTLGLPDWVMPGALVLLLVGLPIILATAILQGRHERSEPSSGRAQPTMAPHWLSWRRALSGGGLAFTALGIATAGYMAMRALGIGPVGTLLAAGVLQERDRLLVADFQNRTPDSLLSSVVTEALRIDLAQSRAVTVIPAAEVVEVLTRMQRSPTARVDLELAREIAAREGIKAVVTGAVAKAGTQYVFSAQLVSASKGEVLAARRETADDSTEIVGAVDRLSRKLREKIGESLKSIRSDPALPRATTASLDALRKYTQAGRAGAQGDTERRIAFLEEAVALDSGFALAYVGLGGALRANLQWEGMVRALTKAFQFRDRLPSLERYYATTMYYTEVTYEYGKAVAAHHAMLELNPNNVEALSSLGSIYVELRQHKRAEEMFLRALARDSSGWALPTFLIDAQLGLGKQREAAERIKRLTTAFPNNPEVQWYAAEFESSIGDYEAAEARTLAIKERHGEELYWREWNSQSLSHLAAVRGRLAEAERHLREGMEASAEGANPTRYLEFANYLAMYDLRWRRQPTRALREVESALARYPLDSLGPLDRPYLALATIYALAGQPKRARAFLAEYELAVHPAVRRAAEPAEYTLRAALGEIAVAEGRVEDAIVEFRKAASRGACTICGLEALGRAYAMAGQVDSAIAVYERHARTQLMQRLTEDAVQLASVHQRLGELYDSRGEREKAREYYSRFVDLWKDCDPELRPQVAEARRRLAALAEGPTT